ncbi:MAG: hypothetical protein MEQ84_14805, partial [Mesorhizobium sp.]|nr:hypothetical protein [Mesorhizobium sp.]
GRRSTVRAFFIYFAAFVLVLYLGWLGVWRAWLEPAIAELAIIVALTGGLGQGSFQQAENLPVYIIDCGGEKQQGADQPAVAGAPVHGHILDAFTHRNPLTGRPVRKRLCRAGHGACP